jgi:hypothetical protein
MEMFQKPFQQPLDDYVAGLIDEREMLRRTEYFDRWKFDHTFYAPLWRHCREHGIRVVALNVEASINSKVGREGLAALTPEERAQCAADIDLTDERHKRRIMGVFQGGAHQMPAARLEKMYEAMTNWDETMADSAARALEAAGPGARMLIVAGGQHVADRTGIPDRLVRRMPHLRGLVIDGETVPTKDGVPPMVELTASFADRDDPPPPKLGVVFDLEPREGPGMLIQSVAQGGAAIEAGVLAGDVLTAFDGTAIRDMADLGYCMDAHRVGDTVAIVVLRGGEEQAFDVTLKPAPPMPAMPAMPGGLPAPRP